MTMYYWAVMPKRDTHQNSLTSCRIEKAATALDALRLAFGEISYKDTAPVAEYQIDRWLVKNLGSNVYVVRTNKHRLAALSDPTGWVDPYEYRKAIFPKWAERFRG